MNNDYINEELSAYLDGESGDPASVGQVLRQDPEAARRYAEYAALSAHLRSLPAPDVPPAFATRVLAHLREDAADRAPVWFTPRRLAWSLAGMAFIALVAVSLTLFVRAGSPDSSQMDNPRVAALPPSQEPIPTHDLDPADEQSGEVALSPLEEYEDTLASIQVLEQVEDTVSATADLDTMLDSLSESELQAFKALLAEYAEGSRSI